MWLLDKLDQIFKSLIVLLCILELFKKDVTEFCCLNLSQPYSCALGKRSSRAGGGAGLLLGLVHLPWDSRSFPAQLSPLPTKLLGMTCGVHSVTRDVLTDGPCLPLADSDNSQVSQWSADSFRLTTQCIQVFERQ